MYVKFTGRVIVNVHDLNNEAAIGNFTDIRKVKIVDSNGNIQEVVAVSGNMLKHWHFIYTKRLLQEKDKLCTYCSREEAWRISDKDSRLTEIIKEKIKGEEKYIKAEEKLITTCAIEDIHGFLSPIGELPIRRESRVRFSWFIPIEGSEEALVTGVHTRVAKIMEEKKEEKEEATEARVAPQQMLFYKQYSSAIYAFSSSIDISRIGISDYSFKPIKNLNEEVIRRRRRAALEALIPILGGETGASMSRALPITKPLEIFLVASQYSGLPNLVGAYFKDYRERNISIMKSIAEITDEEIYAYISPKTGKTLNTSKNLIIKEFDDPLDAVKTCISDLFGD
jgi:CRISPR-associated protein Cst2